MDITITYCGQWNYYPNAASLADAIKKQTGIVPKLVQGAGGIFDVVADGKKIWSKHDSGRFPENREVLGQLTSSR